MELGALGIYRAVVSAEIKRETWAALERPALGGYSREDVDEVLGPFWRVATEIGPAPDDPAYRKAVRDPRDVHLIRAAAAVQLDPDLAPLRHFIVTENMRHFPLGRHWTSFEYADPRRFLAAIK